MSHYIGYACICMEMIKWICNCITSDKSHLLKINTSDQCGLPSILPNTASRILSQHSFVDLELHFQLHNPEQQSSMNDEANSVSKLTHKEDKKMYWNLTCNMCLDILDVQ